ncbi:MAG TPA: hypothetical protein PKD68_02400 [Candidatus Saccharibacteria bacterium]|nr:hypothetical protein [Candidatus Saccharibacteria bacterium]
MKKTTKIKTKALPYEPNKVIFMTAVVGVLTLVAFAGLSTL